MHSRCSDRRAVFSSKTWTLFPRAPLHFAVFQQSADSARWVFLSPQRRRVLRCRGLGGWRGRRGCDSQVTRHQSVSVTHCIFFHVLSFSFMFFHFLSCSFIFFHFLSFSFIFLIFFFFFFFFIFSCFHFLSFSFIFIFFHYLSFSLLCAQNLIFWASISSRFLLTILMYKNQFLGPSREAFPFFLLFFSPVFFFFSCFFFMFSHFLFISSFFDFFLCFFIFLVHFF